jgi:hypothetical protein
MSTPSSLAPPWYKQFWPWVLIGLPATVVVASFNLIYLAYHYSDDLVVDDYYKQGLAINQELTRQRAAEQLGLRAHLAAEGRRVVVTLDGSILEPQLRLLLSHPMEANRDLKLALSRQPNGQYSTSLPTELSGQWHWIIDLGDGSPWRLDGDQLF